MKQCYRAFIVLTGFFILTQGNASEQEKIEKAWQSTAEVRGKDLAAASIYAAKLFTNNDKLSFQVSSIDWKFNKVIQGHAMGRVVVVYNKKSRAGQVAIGYKCWMLLNVNRNDQQRVVNPIEHKCKRSKLTSLDYVVSH